MAEFLEERLCVDVRMGMSYADDYAVMVTETAGGAEYRKLVHGYPRRSWVINFTLLRDDLAARVLSLYHRVYGRYAGFRVRCVDDCNSSTTGRGAITTLDQTLTLISSGVYQLRKQYGAGGTPIGIGLPQRIIYKPVAGTLIVAKNGVTVSSGVSLNTTNGQVTISPAPSGGDVITAGFEFDLPARFNSAIDVSAVSNNIRDCGSIEVLELLAP
jgi:uncharacterized protein (TIGR02217 family)